MRAQLEEAGATIHPPSTIPPAGDEESVPPDGLNYGDDITLTGRERKRLIDAFKVIGHANIELIEEFQETRNRLDESQRTVSRMAWLVAACAVLGLVMMTVVFFRSENVLDKSVQADIHLKKVERNVTATLAVVRAIAEATAYKVKADVESLDPAHRSEADERAQTAANEAAKKAIEVEAEVDPKKRGKMKQRLENLQGVKP